MGSAVESGPIQACAKINLGLRVVGRRHDGYHLIESLFLPLDLRDDVAVSVEDAPQTVVEVELTGDASGVPADASNLAARAAEAFLREAKLDRRVWIRIEKRIPVAAGLGGGSSDAGSVLRALAAALPGALTPRTLASVALRIGADVPYFLDPRPALVGGIGERVEAVAGLPALALVLANPGVALPTAEVYRAWDAIAGEPLASPQGLERAELEAAARSADPVAALAVFATNDLEAAAVRLCPPIARLRDRLRAAGARLVAMSGSGPTVYGVFDSAGAAREGLARAALELPVWARVAATPDSR